MPRSSSSGFPRRVLHAALALGLLAVFAAPARSQDDVRQLVDARSNPSRWDPQARLDYYWVHLFNHSTRNVYGPLRIAISNVGPSPVAVSNPDGVTPEGVPYFDLTPLMGPDNIFAPGEQIKVQIVLSNPDHIRNKNSIHFNALPLANLVPLRVTATAAPASGYAPLHVELAATVMGVANRYEWDFDGDGAFDYSNPASAAIGHVFQSPGTFHPTLRVTGPNDAVTSSVEVEVFAEPSAVTAHAEPNEGVPPLSVHLSASATGRVSLYQWDFEGNGSYDYSNVGSADIDHVYPDPGTFHPTVRVTGGSVSLTASATLTVRPNGPPSAPVLDDHPALLRELAIDLGGRAPGADAVEVSAPTGIFQVPVTAGRFSAHVPLQQNSMNHIVFTSLSPLGRGASAATQVTNDLEAPTVAITFPASDAVIFRDTTDVTGRVSDLLSGFNGLTVVVNGVSAEVDIGIGTNGTFLARNVPIGPSGLTNLVATASDALGNQGVDEIDVTRGVVPPDAPYMTVVSGERQAARVMTLLPQPIVVRVLHADGSPFADKIVTFHVVRSNGGLSADGTGPGALTAQVRSDAEGEARAFWRVGGDAGCGNNRVEVSSTDIVGTFTFCASAMAAPAAQINVGTGNNQKTETDAPTPEPLKVWVSDGCNGVAGIPVVFRVVQGGGQVNGSDSVVVNTGPTGHAEVAFRLGFDPGNNIVEATFPGQPDQVARFVAVGLHRDLQAPTRLDGLVLDNSSQPIGGASCSVIIGNATVASGVSDAAGQFHFSGIPAGQAKLHVDGLPATMLNGHPIPAGSFPALTFDLLIVPNADNSLPTPVLLPPLNPHNARAYSTTHDVELTVEGIEGLKMIVHAGSMRLPNGSPAPDGTIIALNQVHHDKVPMPMPDGAAPPFAWTLQPGGAHFDPPVTIIYPNMSALPPGAIAYFLSFNHETNRFEIVAPGSVTEDGLNVVTDAGTGIHVAGWGCNCPPYSVTGSCQNCTESCVANGALSGGQVDVTDDRRYACVVNPPETITFTASGVTDNGGRKRIVCQGRPDRIVDIPAGTITYEYEVLQPGTLGTLMGTGSSVSVTPTVEGDYVCRFKAKSQRDCPPADLTLPDKTLTAIKVQFKKDPAQVYGFDDYSNRNVVPPTPYKSVAVGESDPVQLEFSPGSAAAGLFLKSDSDAIASPSPTQPGGSPASIQLTSGSRGETNVNANADAIDGPTCNTVTVATYPALEKQLFVVVVTEENDDVQIIPVGKGLPNVACVRAPILGSLHTTPLGDDAVSGSTITTGSDGICQTTATGGDVQLIPVGNGSPNEVCVEQGTNGERDTPLSGDDRYTLFGIGDDITTGPDGICDTAANGTPLIAPDVSGPTIETDANAVYAQAAISWTVSKSTATINYDLDFDAIVATAGVSFSAEQERLIDRWPAPADFDPDVDRVVFIVNALQTAPNRCLYGIMPFDQPYGFVASGTILSTPGCGTGITVQRTVSHEIGHGQNLHHTNDDTITDNDNDMMNLMIATPPHGPLLRKYEWDILHP